MSLIKSTLSSQSTFLNLKKRLSYFALVTLAAISISSCKTSQLGISEANSFIRWEKSDFDISPKVSAEAKEIRVLGVDWSRLFKKESGNFNQRGYAIDSKSPIPLLGSKLSPTMVQNYALQKLLSENADYDVILYPRFEQKSMKFLFFYKKTETKVSARLGKL